MAAEGDVSNDLNAHRSGYSLFTAMMKWGTIVSFIVAMVVVLVIAS